MTVLMTVNISITKFSFLLMQTVYLIWSMRSDDNTSAMHSYRGSDLVTLIRSRVSRMSYCRSRAGCVQCTYWCSLTIAFPIIKFMATGNCQEIIKIIACLYICTLHVLYIKDEWTTAAFNMCILRKCKILYQEFIIIIILASRMTVYKLHDCIIMSSFLLTYEMLVKCHMH